MRKRDEGGGRLHIRLMNYTRMHRALYKICGAGFVALLVTGAVYSGVLSGTQVDLAPQAEGAAVDYFLKIEGVEGESKDNKHKGEINVESWSWGIMSPRDAASGLPTGKRQHKPFVITKEIDKASPKLMLACANGKHFEEMVLTTSSDKRPDYVRYSFFDVFCSEFDNSGAGGAVPTEQISFNFAKVRIEYKEQDAKGVPGATHTAEWDFSENRGE